MHVIMGIDCSYHSTGLVILKDDEILFTERVESNKEEGVCQHLDRVRRVILKHLHVYRVEMIALEDLNLTTNFKTAQVLLRVQGMIMALAYEHLEEEVAVYHNQTWRSRMGIKPIRYEYEEYMSKSRKTGKEKKAKKRIYEYVIEDGKKIKKDIKWVTVQKINEVFGLNLKYADNDIADALGIAKCLQGELHNER